MRRLITSASLIATLTLSTAAFAQMGSGGPGHHHGPDGAWMHELKSLNLTDAQHTQIHGFFEAAHQQDEASHKAMHDLHHSYEAAVPGTPAFSALTTQMADAESAQARERVLQMAQIRTQIYGVLTAEQRTQLAAEIASRP